MDLGRLGVWWSGSWRWEDDASVDVAAQVEDLGYTALWSSAVFSPGLPPRFGRLLASTTRVAVASGIASIWATPPEDLARDVADLDAEYPGRFLLGLGASHGPVVDNYNRPYAHMVSYLDGLDATAVVTKDRRILAALGPRMLELWPARSAGRPSLFRSRGAHGPGPPDPRGRTAPRPRGHGGPRA